jgi:superfamily II RNA helicase
MSRKTNSESDYWIQGIQIFLQSQTTKLIFTHSRPEDKYNFISTSIFEPILKLQDKKSSVLESNILKLVIKELMAWPYISFALLKYP